MIRLFPQQRHVYFTWIEDNPTWGETFRVVLPQLNCPQLDAQKPVDIESGIINNSSGLKPIDFLSQDINIALCSMYEEARKTTGYFMPLHFIQPSDLEEMRAYVKEKFGAQEPAISIWEDGLSTYVSVMWEQDGEYTGVCPNLSCPELGINFDVHPHKIRSHKPIPDPVTRPSLTALLAIGFDYQYSSLAEQVERDSGIHFVQPFKTMAEINEYMAEHYGLKEELVPQKVKFNMPILVPKSLYKRPVFHLGGVEAVSGDAARPT